MGRFLLFIGLCFVGTGMLYAQGSNTAAEAGDWSGQVHFTEDSVRVGDPTPVVVSLRYPSQWQVLLPDSTTDFGLFEYSRHTYTPTRSQGPGYSYDSAVYYLSTFEVEEMQPLRLPFLIVREKDTLRYTLGGDSIRLWDVVVPFPDTLRTEASAPLVPLKREFNQPYFLTFGILGLVVILLLAAILARPLARWWRLRRLQQKHARWHQRQQQLSGALATTLGSPETAESWMHNWKSYLEQLEGIQYTRLTSRELARLPEVQGVVESLRLFDKAIYGARTVEQLPEESQRLMDFATRRYQKAVERVRQ